MGIDQLLRNYRAETMYCVDISFVYETLIGKVYKETSKLPGDNNEYLELQNVITYRKAFLDDLVRDLMSYSIKLWNSPRVRFDLPGEDVYDPFIELLDDVEVTVLEHQVVNKRDTQLLDNVVEIITTVMEKNLIGLVSDIIAGTVDHHSVEGFEIQSRRSRESGYIADLILKTT